jgi:nicotinate dehydrogenase subunit B
LLGASDRNSCRVRVPRAFAAADAGQIINPDGLANQIEGGMIQSTSWTLHEAVRFDRHGILSRDWSGYPILTMPEVPEVLVSLLDRDREKPLGAGEASQGPMAAAIANAFANATGRRLRELPFTPERVQAALG